jgi:hypothetical protein
VARGTRTVGTCSSPIAATPTSTMVDESDVVRNALSDVKIVEHGLRRHGPKDHQFTEIAIDSARVMELPRANVACRQAGPAGAET